MVDTKHSDSGTPSLWELNRGESCVLTGFDTTLDPDYQERIFQLGFQPNTRVTCLKSPAFGAPKVYRINSSVFSIENSLASCIFIQKATEEVS